MDASSGGFLSGSRVLTQRYADFVFPDDDRDEPTVYDLGSGERTALLDLTELAVDQENDELSSAEVLDGSHVLVPGRVCTGDPSARPAGPPGAGGRGRHRLWETAPGSRTTATGAPLALDRTGLPGPVR
ncbi:hypothetical protein AB0M97_13615 [Streptomyces sp. NPDC051207]|uniref:hypothetical protein n=1 Tax=Streptomyces sp. NPDC051207 TaxID=3154641 RepID=UPI00341AF329